MAVISNRSMNDDLRIGAVDGRLRFLRPSATQPEMEAVLIRADTLAGPHYGNMGVSYGNKAAIASMLPGAVHPLQPLRISKHDVIDPL